VSARDPASDRAGCSQGIVVTTFAEMGVRFLGFPATILFARAPGV